MPAHRFHGLELPVRACSGARAIRVVHPPGQRIDDHQHDWPLLTIPALGGYREECDEGSVDVDGPAAILHPAGRCHANCIHHRGMETFSIEFDPDWLRLGDFGLRLDRSHYWVGGEVALASQALARMWHLKGATESDLRTATASFLLKALRHAERPAPAWFAHARRLVEAPDPLTTAEIARWLDLHPAWLASRYRRVAGEGLHETIRRQRVEKAVELLRSTDDPIAHVAAAVGFCDQSHLNRAVRALTGRTPLRVRSERDALRLMSAPSSPASF